MDTSENQKTVALKRVKRVEKSFETIMMLIENNDIESVAILTKRIFDDLQSLFDDIRALNEPVKLYMNMVLAQKISWFDDDRENLNAYVDEKYAVKKAMPDHEIKAIAKRLEVAITLTRREVKSIFSAPFDVRKFALEFYSQYKKVLAASLGVLLVFGGIAGIKNYFYVKKHSLIGDYFKDAELTELYTSRRASVVDFNWGEGAPLLGFKRDHFSIRWTGFIRIPNAGDYEFVTRADDGARLWVNNQLLVDDWKSHSPETHAGRIHLDQGIVPIKLEYFDDFASAEIHLLWKLPSDREPSVIKPIFFLSDKKYF